MHDLERRSNYFVKCNLLGSKLRKQTHNMRTSHDVRNKYITKVQ